jgi:predicted RNase H-like HicB family nuclease
MIMVTFTAAVSWDVVSSMYVARCLEVEVTSQGESTDAALANLRDAVALFYEDEPLESKPARVWVSFLAVDVAVSSHGSEA